MLKDALDWLLNRNTSDPHQCRPDVEKDWVLLPGRESSSTAEARFMCKYCKRERFRGGWGSCFKYEPEKKHRD